MRCSADRDRGVSSCEGAADLLLVLSSMGSDGGGDDP
jgi:hypothetical protein